MSINDVANGLICLFFPPPVYWLITHSTHNLDCDMKLVDLSSQAFINDMHVRSGSVCEQIIEPFDSVKVVCSLLLALIIVTDWRQKLTVQVDWCC